MINKLNKKLRSNTGSSLILVLMLFFMCVMVSSIVVAVAGSGAGRIAKRQTQQQGYLSVISAVELAIDEMNECGGAVGIETTIDYGCNDLGHKYYSPAFIEETRYEDKDPDGALGYHHNDVTANRAAVNEVDVWQVDGNNLKGIFADLLKTACTAVYDSGEEKYTNSFTIESDDDRLTNVHCDFTMYGDYTITMTFTGENTNYTMTVIFPYAPSDPTEEHTPYICSHKVKGKREENGAVSEEFDEKIPREFGGDIKTVKTQITWGTPTIIKGVE